MPESPLPKNLSNMSGAPRRTSSSDTSPSTQLDHDKRARREIANSNERRRMQSINTGFQTLKILIPHSCGEKLSKACILQRAADHIKSLENEKLKLQSQNEQFRILIKSFQIDSSSVLQAQNDEQTIVCSMNQTSNKIDQFYRTVPTTTSEPNIKPNPRCYKANSVDQTSDHGLFLVERCQLRTQSVDTPAIAPRANLQTIVEAIRHLEGEEVLENIGSTPTPTINRNEDDLPAQIKALINEKFSQTSKKNNLESVLQQRPPKKRKITFNDIDEPPIGSPDVHHHEQVSTTSSVGQFIHEDLIERRSLNF